MGIWESVVVALGLSMDAFAAAVVKGLASGRDDRRGARVAGAYFGAFQALMPALGFLIAYPARQWIEGADHWIAFSLMALIGAGMIRDSLSGGGEGADASLSFSAMLPLAVATSIDALAVGVTHAVTGGTGIAVPALIIGAITYCMAYVGVRAGGYLGKRFRTGAQIAGGAVLIAMGARVLFLHLANA